MANTNGDDHENFMGAEISDIEVDDNIIDEWINDDPYDDDDFGYDADQENDHQVVVMDVSTDDDDDEETQLQPPDEMKDTDQAGGGDASLVANASSSDPAKGRLKWTADLHSKFIQVVDQLGGPNAATPKCIIRRMKVRGLNLYHIKSHLQKYRHRLENKNKPEAADQDQPMDASEGTKNEDGGVPPAQETNEPGNASEVPTSTKKRMNPSPPGPPLCKEKAPATSSTPGKKIKSSNVEGKLIIGGNAHKKYYQPLVQKAGVYSTAPTPEKVTPTSVTPKPHVIPTGNVPLASSQIPPRPSQIPPRSPQLPPRPPKPLSAGLPIRPSSGFPQATMGHLFPSYSRARQQTIGQLGAPSASNIPTTRPYFSSPLSGFIPFRPQRSILNFQPQVTGSVSSAFGNPPSNSRPPMNQPNPAHNTSISGSLVGQATALLEKIIMNGLPGQKTSYPPAIVSPYFYPPQKASCPLPSKNTMMRPQPAVFPPPINNDVIAVNENMSTVTSNIQTPIVDPAPNQDRNLLQGSSSEPIFVPENNEGPSEGGLLSEDIAENFLNDDPLSQYMSWLREQGDL